MSANPIDPGWPVAAIDLHQHLWPEALVDRLRARSRTPYLRGWTLFTHGEAPYEIEPDHHDVKLRLHQNARDGIGLACLSLSAPLGIESLRGPSAAALLDAWHEGAAALPPGFQSWASVRRDEPDLAALATLLEDGLVGVQVPATDVRTPSGWERLAPVLDVAERAGKPVLVHPGPVEADPEAAGLPAWWPAVVGYASQLQASWWAWHAGNVRASHPTLRVVFAGGGRARSGAPRTARRAGRYVGHGGPARPRGHVVVRTPGPRRTHQSAGDRRPGARERPAVRRAGRSRANG